MSEQKPIDERGKEIYLLMLTQIPGIDMDMAKRIVNHFGCLENFVWHVVHHKEKEKRFECANTEGLGLTSELLDNLYRLFQFQEWVDHEAKR